MKKPSDCSTIEEIRQEIDGIDSQVIGLIGKRFQYIQEIIRYKKDEQDVLARNRYDLVLETRRRWAVEAGLDPDVIEEIYKTLIHYFIAQQKKLLNLT